MLGLRTTLLGKFTVEWEGLRVNGIEARKVQELLCYLLIYRNHPQSRETLSEVLWGNQSSATSRKSLRQSLWRLQSALKIMGNSSEPMLLIEDDWIEFRLPAYFWLDIAEFQSVFDLVKGKKVQELNKQDFHLLEHTAAIYKGDLLEGWCQDWCIFERERFQTMHLLLLDKLVQFCEFHQCYELGLAYGMEILRHDHAYERTHRQLMRLHAMIGNRTQALQQYARCVTALRDELNVEPSERTKQLYEQIRLDAFRVPLSISEKINSQSEEGALALHSTLSQLEQFAETLRKVESQVQQEIAALKVTLSSQR